jgi:arginyl-tRNA synthetase
MAEIGFKKEMAHVGYDFVTLKDGEGMSSRKGNIVPANFLMEQVEKKVGEKFPDSPDPEGISLGAIKFFMLKYSSRTKIEFDIEESVKLEGSTGPYVQYAHARICSILSKAKEQKIDFRQADLSKLTHEKELMLIRELDKFPQLVAEVAQSYEVHKLPYYAIHLADKFHSFYNDLKVIDADNLELTAARLKLIAVTKIVLREVLRLIGVSAPDRM